MGRMKTEIAFPPTITCSMCQHVFDPNGNETCLNCPLHSNCQLVRCPACGFETVDPRQSRLARLAAHLFKKEL
jgi:rubredoxin